MERKVIKTDGTTTSTWVGDGFESWNEAIGARVGTIVVSPDRTVELWCDDEGLMVAEPQLTLAASMLVGQQIVGDVIYFMPGDIK